MWSSLVICNLQSNSAKRLYVYTVDIGGLLDIYIYTDIEERHFQIVRDENPLGFNGK